MVGMNDIRDESFLCQLNFIPEALSYCASAPESMQEKTVLLYGMTSLMPGRGKSRSALLNLTK